MTAGFEIMPYKAMAGYYIRVTWEDGYWTSIDDSSTREPAFLTEADAQIWIDKESGEWLRHYKRAFPLTQDH